ncbi:MAG: AraC family transcriptional regulator [Advenella sp.]|uniref:AraC family transcriptional regulator n=1 Tax=Advenella sp. S44 TaxID=1982755 RepID=UPI001F5B1308|nr:helix-turn-helix transcriptional regulator [Advenella sp. S44]
MSAQLRRSINAEDYQDIAPAVAAMSKEFALGTRTAVHSHRRAQLLFASRGVIRVSTDKGYWLLPPLRALWVPPNVPHTTMAVSHVDMRTLYVDANAARALWADCQVIEVSNLMRELILSLTAEPVIYSQNERGGRIAALILSELPSAQTVATRIPWPRDRRLISICTAIMDQPGLNRPLGAWADAVGASERTLIRLFQSELGMNYRQWLQQVRLADAVCRLSMGQSIATIARELGYHSPSAFSAMFRRALGIPPNIYLQTARA